METARVRAARVAIIPAGAFAAWTFWWLEMFVARSGEHFLSWLHEFNWSAIPICLTIATVCAFTVRPGRGRFRPLAFIACASLLFLSAFVVTKAAFQAFYGAALGAAFSSPFPYGPVAQLAAAGLGVAALLPLLARWSLGPVRLWTIFALSVVFVLVAPVSELIGYSGLIGRHGGLDDVKLGYPVILSALLTPLVMHFGSRGAATEYTASHGKSFTCH